MIYVLQIVINSVPEVFGLVDSLEFTIQILHVLNDPEIGCCSLLWQGESIAEVNCSLSEQWCCCSQWTDSSKGLPLVCKNEDFAHVLQALPLCDL